MKSLIKKILNEPELKEKPPVLLDIGASGQVHHKWKQIARYSICLAFDADERDFRFVEKEHSNFRKLYVFNCAALDKDINKSEFFLTKSPYCSSVLEPNIEKLKLQVISNLFEVEKKVQLNSIHIQKALDKAKLDYVDWFKTDSQGIDLRLFNALNEPIKSKILVAEFEPGIIDAYLGEDKLHSVIRELCDSGFWLSDIIVKGAARLPKEILDSEFRGSIVKKFIKESLKKAPGWGELTFINSFENSELGRREFLLGWLFSSIERHHSFALVIAITGIDRFGPDVFSHLKSYSIKQIKKEVYKFKFLPSLIDLGRKKLS
jgi:hypothetical protein